MKYFFKVHPLKTLLQEKDYAPFFRRINREKAIEKLNNWLSYLAETDPTLYQLVKQHIKDYDMLNK